MEQTTPKARVCAVETPRSEERCLTWPNPQNVGTLKRVHQEKLVPHQQTVGCQQLRTPLMLLSQKIPPLAQTRENLNSLGGPYARAKAGTYMNVAKLRTPHSTFTSASPRRCQKCGCAAKIGHSCFLSHACTRLFRPNRMLRQHCEYCCRCHAVLGQYNLARKVSYCAAHGAACGLA